MQYRDGFLLIMLLSQQCMYNLVRHPVEAATMFNGVSTFVYIYTFYSSNSKLCVYRHGYCLFFRYMYSCYVMVLFRLLIVCAN